MNIQPNVRTEVSSLPIRIFVGTTYIALYADEQGFVAPGITIAPFIRTHLQEREWVIPQGEGNLPLPGRWITVANYTLREPNGLAHLPRYSLPALMDYLGMENVSLIPLPPVTPKLTPIPMKRRFQLRENQVQPVEFLTNNQVGFMPLNLPCAAGKTTISLYASSVLQGPLLVILPLLVKQWYDRIREFTDVKKEDIYVIQGITSLQTLWKAVERGYQPKIVLAAMRTLGLYAIEYKGPYAQLPPWIQLQEAIGFNVAAMDEVHLWFSANVKMQLTLNIKNNIFLSATFARSDWRQDQIFQNIFPKEIRYAPDTTNKFTTTNMIQYSLGIVPSIVGKFNTSKYGYNHARYEKYLLKKPGYMNYFIMSVLIPLIQMYYINSKKKGQKCLVLNWTRAMSEYQCKKIKQAFPDLKVRTYFSGSTPESNLTDSDIIVSTHKSCGVGTDIKGLKTCINTVSFGSAVLAQQLLGRLREIPGEDIFFVDIWNRDIGTHLRHKFDRLRVYKQHSKVVYETQIT